MPNAPWWLDHYETQTGAPARLAGSRAVPKKCPACGRWTLEGLDAPRMAGLACIDPYLATMRQEAAAVILGIPSYRIWGHVGSWSLTPRYHPQAPLATWELEPATIASVVLGHTCKQPLASKPLDKPLPISTHDKPPF